MMDWKKNLTSMLLNSVEEAQSVQETSRQDQERINKFFSLVKEAFEEIKAEIEKYGRRVDIHLGKTTYAIDIYNGSKMEFTYAVKVRRYTPTVKGDYNFYGANRFDPKDCAQRYNFTKIHTIDKERIIQDFMTAYQKQIRAKPSQARLTIY
ncbi:MAG: hypothetical protein JWN98_1217 [Abditibacteriota bacterium]|nr:hypothetical protein [Abditibacteriota bacterium]